MNSEQRALALVERIYEATVDPSTWSLFVEDLAKAYGGAAVGLTLELPGFDPWRPYYPTGFRTRLPEVFARHFRRGLPWQAGFTANFLGRFGLASELFPDERVAETEFYREWMKPQGLAPVCPISHVIALEGDRPTAALAIYRRAGSGGPFCEDDLELVDLLVPHLARACALHRRFGGVQRERVALAEVVDRLPTGVILFDAARRAVVVNRSAARIAALRDGLELHDRELRTAVDAETQTLRSLLDGAIERARGSGPLETAVTSISRPSGRRPFPVLVSPLLRAPLNSAGGDAVAALFVSDLDARQLSMTEVLQSLYQLTQAEAELVRLLAEGRSLEEAAQVRGVTVNTARSQLKQVFTKTSTHRQGELVRVVLQGVAPILDERSEDGSASRGGIGS